VNELLRKSGIFFLLALYGLSISFTGLALAPKGQHSEVNECVETLRDAFSVVLMDHSNQLDLHVVSAKEQSESNGSKGFPLNTLSFVCLLPFEFVSTKNELSSREVIPLQFDQTDIIFPFHYFF
jgi:hypothetical protein